jgi:hypothetical protein
MQAASAERVTGASPHAVHAVPHRSGARWRKGETAGSLLYRQSNFALPAGFPVALAMPLQPTVGISHDYV